MLGCSLPSMVNISISGAVNGMSGSQALFGKFCCLCVYADGANGPPGKPKDGTLEDGELPWPIAFSVHAEI